MSEFVHSRIESGVATIEIDRAGRHNSLVPDLLDEFVEVVETLADDGASRDGESAQNDETVRAVVLTTAGPSFSTGGDVRGFYEHREKIEAYAERTVGGLNDAILALCRLDAPVVAAVDGQVTGGSLGFLLAADVVVVTPDATITPYYARVGFSPDGGWTAMLPDVIGPKRVGRILLADETIQPEQAVEWGLASEIVAREEVHEEAHRIARRISSMKRGSVVGAKRLLGPDLDDLEARLERERRAFVEQIATEEAMEGMEAFLG